MRHIASIPLKGLIIFYKLFLASLTIVVSGSIDPKYFNFAAISYLKSEHFAFSSNARYLIVQGFTINSSLCDGSFYWLQPGASLNTLYRRFYTFLEIVAT